MAGAKAHRSVTLTLDYAVIHFLNRRTLPDRLVLVLVVGAAARFWARAQLALLHVVVPAMSSEAVLGGRALGYSTVSMIPGGLDIYPRWAAPASLEHSDPLTNVRLLAAEAAGR